MIENFPTTQGFRDAYVQFSFDEEAGQDSGSKG